MIQSLHDLFNRVEGIKTCILTEHLPACRAFRLIINLGLEGRRVGPWFLRFAEHVQSRETRSQTVAYCLLRNMILRQPGGSLLRSYKPAESPNRLFRVHVHEKGSAFAVPPWWSIVTEISDAALERGPERKDLTSDYEAALLWRQFILRQAGFDEIGPLTDSDLTRLQEVFDRATADLDVVDFDAVERNSESAARTAWDILLSSLGCSHLYFVMPLFCGFSNGGLAFFSERSLDEDELTRLGQYLHSAYSGLVPLCVSVAMQRQSFASHWRWLHKPELKTIEALEQLVELPPASRQRAAQLLRGLFEISLLECLGPDQLAPEDEELPLRSWTFERISSFLQMNARRERISVRQLVEKLSRTEAEISGDAEVEFPSLLMALLREAIEEIVVGAEVAAPPSKARFRIETSQDRNLTLVAEHRGLPIVDPRFSYDPMPSRGWGSRGLGIYLAGMLARRLGGDLDFRSDMRETRVNLRIPLVAGLEDYISSRHENI